MTPGMHPVPAGHIAMVVTFLEMTAPAPLRPAPLPEGADIMPWPEPALADYRAMMDAIGRDWLWSNRLRLSDAALSEAIHHPEVQLFRLLRGKHRLGLLELSFKLPDTCEVSFFGVVPEAIGTTAARCLMNRAIELAWTRPIRRMQLNTCTLDHPAALDFYRRSGFTEFKRAVEVMRDPRLDGTLPREAAPNVAVLE